MPKRAPAAAPADATHRFANRGPQPSGSVDFVNNPPSYDAVVVAVRNSVHEQRDRCKFVRRVASHYRVLPVCCWQGVSGKELVKLHRQLRLGFPDLVDKLVGGG